MPNIHDIFNAISTDDFSSSTLQFIDNYTNDIQNGTTNFYRFTIPEHAGLCTAGPALIGASVVASYARASLTASRDASGSQGSPNSWEIDELQEQLIEQWAKAANLWEDDSENILIETFGPKIAEGSEANVFIDELTDKPIFIDCIVKFK